MPVCGLACLPAWLYAPVCIWVRLPACPRCYLYRSVCTSNPTHMVVGLSVCLVACQSACLCVCLPACLYVCPRACLSVCMPVCMPACVCMCLPVCLSVCLSAGLAVCPPVSVLLIGCLHVGLPANLPAWLHVCVAGNVWLAGWLVACPCLPPCLPAAVVLSADPVHVRLLCCHILSCLVCLSACLSRSPSV